jgi:hypothetical protein
MLADIVDVSQNVIVPEAENSPAILLEAERPCEIGGGCFVVSVLRAVNIDDKLLLWANKVGDITGNRKLPPEAEPHQPVCA